MKPINFRSTIKNPPSQLLAIALGSALALSAHAQANISDDKVKIGVIADMSGPLADTCGQGCVEAVKMAVEDFGGKVLGKPIEIVAADDQNKPDIGSAKVREWVERDKVDVVAGHVSSAVTGAVTKVLQANKKIALITGSGSHTFTTSACSPFNAHWTYDVYSMANGTVTQMVKNGKKKWFFLTADYAFGHALEKVATQVIAENGGEVVGSVRAPLGTTDYASYILQAAASGADVIALANGGPDMVNSLKTASEFGVTETMDVAGLLVFAHSIQALDPAISSGMRMTSAFYWDMDQKTRDWSKRYMARMDGRIPLQPQAGAYSSTMHYLKAVEAAGTDESNAVMAKMKATPVNDFFSRNGYLRKDGRMVHDMLQVRVKTAEERTSPNDVFAIENIIPGDEVFQPMEVGGCEFALNPN